MPDISMCVNINCELKESCYRFRAVPNPHRQSYSSWKPKDGECDGFYPITKGDKIVALKCNAEHK